MLLEINNILFLKYRVSDQMSKANAKWSNLHTNIFYMKIATPRYKKTIYY